MRSRITLVIVALVFATAAASAAQFTSPYVTRAEAVMFLLKTRGVTVPNIKNKGRFNDISDNAWYTRYMITGERLGLVEPDVLGKYLRPNETVNRAQYLKMLSIAFGLKDFEPYLYIDVPSDAWYARYAGNAEKYGLFADDDSQYLEPARPITHRQAAAAVHKVIRQKQVTRRSPFFIKIPRKSIVQRAKELLPHLSKPVLDLFATQKYVLSIPKEKKTEEEAQLLTFINQKRLENNAPLLRRNTLLDEAAQRFAEDMFSRRYYSHYSPEGRNHGDRIAAVGYVENVLQPRCVCPPPCTCRYELGENIAKNLTPLEVVTAWLRSPKHKKNMLYPAFQHIGIGRKEDTWVNLYGGMTVEQD